jgi:hypothetical protein
MKLTELKKLIKETIQEEQDYNKLFVHMLDKTHKSLADMSDMEKKHFFNAVDKAYKAKSEGRLRGYNEAELTAGQKQLDVDKDGEIEGSDLAKLRNQNEVGTNDWHFKAIMKMYDMAGSYGKKKISAAVNANTNSNRREIERGLRDTDYHEISNISDKLGLKEIFNRIAQKKN